MHSDSLNSPCLILCRKNSGEFDYKRRTVSPMIPEIVLENGEILRVEISLVNENSHGCNETRDTRISTDVFYSESVFVVDSKRPQ